MLRYNLLERNPTLFFFICTAVGAFGVFFLTVPMVEKMVEARSWEETPCVVKSSRVQTFIGGKGGRTYKIDVEYAYSADGREFHSRQYDLLDCPTDAYDRKTAIVGALPPGLHTVCYVNPDDPTSAVLDRSFNKDMLLGTFPLIFLMAGLAGLVFRFRHGLASHFRTPEGDLEQWVATEAMRREALKASHAGR